MSRAVQRLRWPLPIVAALASAGLDRGAYVLDGFIFFAAGHHLVSGAWASTYASPGVQAGPVQLLLYGGAQLIAQATRMPVTSVLAVLVEVGVTAASVAVTGTLLRGRRGRDLAQLLVGLASVVFGVAHWALVSGHPAEMVVPLMWIAAAAEVRDGRFGTAGWLIGLSTGWELWGILGVPVALLARRPRDVVRILGHFAAAVAVLWTPFLVAGSFHMFAYRWFVTVQSPLNLVWRVPVGTQVPWAWRLVQGAVAVGAGAGVARWRRGSPHAPWEVLIAVVAARLAFDPMNFGYYWLAVVTLAMLAVAEVASGRGATRVEAHPAEILTS